MPSRIGKAKSLKVRCGSGVASFRHKLTYVATALPDPRDRILQEIANGDVAIAVWWEWEQLLHTLAGLPPGEASAALHFIFRAPGDPRDGHDRLRLVLALSASNEVSLAALRSLVEGGPLARFYGLRIDGGAKLLAHAPRAATYDVTRCVRSVAPVHGSGINRFVLPTYLVFQPLETNGRNDYLALDRALDGIGKSVRVSIRAESADASRERREYARYEERLARIASHRVADEAGLDDVLDAEWATRPRHRPLHEPEPVAADVLRRQRRFGDALYQPQLLFRIHVAAETPAAARAVASVVAGCAFGSGSGAIQACPPDEAEVPPSTDDLNGPLAAAPRPQWKSQAWTQYQHLARLEQLATVDELCGAFRFPVASYGSPVCIRKNTDPPVVPADELIVLGEDHGGAHDRSRMRTSAIRGPKVWDLLKHGFVGGLPGSGKTTSTMGIVVQLMRRGIPCLVLETAKREYRILKALTTHPNQEVRQAAEALRIYTIGAEDVSPFRFNPLQFPPGINCAQHVEALLECFRASMPLFGPLPAVLGEALERVYEAFPDPDQPPVLTELLKCATNVLVEKGYSGDIASDFRAALEVRLGMLTRRTPASVFQCRESVPNMRELLNTWSIIELERVPPEPKCLLVHFLLTSLREHLQLAGGPADKPRIVVIIEEAHNVVGPSANTAPQENLTDPKAHTAEFVCRMLAEVRGLGAGIILVNQLPSAVAPEVLKNTGWKLEFRQVGEADRTEVGRDMLCTPGDIEELARLGVGEAFFFAEGYHAPRRLRTPGPPPELASAAVLRDDEMFARISRDEWFRSGTLQRTACELDQLEQELSRLEAYTIWALRHARQLVDQHKAILKATSRGAQRRHLLGRLHALARRHRQAVRLRRDSFRRGPLQGLLGRPGPIDRLSRPLAMRGRKITRRYEDVSTAQLEASLALMQDLINRCRRGTSGSGSNGQKQ